MSRGDFDRLVTFKQAVTATNDYGEEIATSDTVLAEAWARVRFGRADEKREAAQEGGIQSATFEFMPNEALLAAPLTAVIEFEGSDWNIVSPPELLERNLLRFTAVRGI